MAQKSECWALLVRDKITFSSSYLFLLKSSAPLSSTSAYVFNMVSIDTMHSQ